MTVCNLNEIDIWIDDLKKNKRSKIRSVWFWTITRSLVKIAYICEHINAIYTLQIKLRIILTDFIQCAYM